jgi:hypothetical protein
MIKTRNMDDHTRQLTTVKITLEESEKTMLD